MPTYFHDNILLLKTYNKYIYLLLYSYIKTIADNFKKKRCYHHPLSPTFHFRIQIERMDEIYTNIDSPPQKFLFSVRDMTLRCDVSEVAVRMHFTRRTGFLPEPIKTGTKRHYWTSEQLTAHFRSLTPPPSPPPPLKKTGRPPSDRLSPEPSRSRRNETPPG